MPTPPDESVHEQVVATLVSKLAEISAVSEPTVFWYTPLVLAVEELDPRYLRPSDDVVYQVLDGDSHPIEETTGSFDEEGEVYIVAAKKWKPTPYKAWTPYIVYTPSNPSPRTIRNRLVQDIQTKIYRDVTLDMEDVTLNVEVKDVSRDLRFEQGEMWVAVELRVVITYSFRKDNP